LSKDVSGLDWIYQVKEEWINLGLIYQVDLGWIWVGSKKIKLRKDGSGLGQIYQVELGLIRVGLKKNQVELGMGWIRVGSDISS